MGFVTIGATLLPWRRSHLSYFSSLKILTDRLGQRRPSGAARARQCYCYIYHIIIIIFASHYSYSLLSRTLSLTSIPIANFTSGDQVEVGMLMLYDLIPI